MSAPLNPKIYHIVHMDRLPSIIQDQHLWCDSKMCQKASEGTMIGMNEIKQRRLSLPLSSRPGVYVGDCVPFYFCYRSVMLYVISRRNNLDLKYTGGQKQIVHLEFDMHTVIQWAEKNNHGWAFTLSNAGAYYFEDRCDINELSQIDWQAVNTTWWIKPSLKEGKQAEFLVEKSVSWQLIERLGVCNQDIAGKVAQILHVAEDKTTVQIKPDWYY